MSSLQAVARPLHNRLGERWTPLAVALLLCAALILLLTLIFNNPSPSSSGYRMGVLLVDRWTTVFPYPFTIQNLEHVIFAVGLGELWVRWRTARRELAFVEQRYLPEDEHTVLQAEDLGPIRRAVSGKFDGENGFLPSLIDLCVLQFQASRSVDQTVSVLNSSLELISHRVDLRYQLSRYFSWLIPTIGFVGTVVGIAATLSVVSSGKPDLGLLAATLTVAFDTTIVALIESAILVLLMNVVQGKEERAVNLAGQYALRNLINRLYSGKAPD
ncbi:MAG: MotA/TolQ/ExbB proton channel family protein [Burkholderiales bacterium]|nr:MotA/TolQ/ExbB proton channel family protein [Burkholderiales bacterium]